MFNPKVREVYDERTIKEFEFYAEKMEKAGRHVILASPSNLVQGMVFPCIVGIENWTWEDFEELYAMYKIITEGRPFIEWDYEMINPGEYADVSSRYGGIELWVK